MNKYMIYPKQYRNENVPVQKNKCFFLMQFSKDLDLVYGTIKKALEEEGIICMRSDEIIDSPVVINKILYEIFSSRFIIAELSYNNPNVFYELGIAHSFKDSSNIILIRQETDNKLDYPFDLKHLQYIEYSPTNLKLLTAQIVEYIKKNKFINDFYEVLNIKGIISYISDNRDAFVEYIQTNLNEEIVLITKTLNNEPEIERKDIERLFAKYENIINKAIVENNINILEGLFRVYFELIFNCPFKEISEIYLNKFLNNEITDMLCFDIVMWKVELIKRLLIGKRHLNTCIPWIINFFSKIKATTIDLNRYKLEELLLTCNYEELNEGIIAALYSKNCYVRESMADIIGEKHLKEATESLFNRLEEEQNIYVSRSIVEAIGKVDDGKNLERLESWFERHKEIFEERRYNGIYSHMLYAIKRLDKSNNKEKLNDFYEKYKTKFDFPEII